MSPGSSLLVQNLHVCELTWCRSGPERRCWFLAHASDLLEFHIWRASRLAIFHEVKHRLQLVWKLLKTFTFTHSPQVFVVMLQIALTASALMHVNMIISLVSKGGIFFLSDDRVCVVYLILGLDGVQMWIFVLWNVLSVVLVSLKRWHFKYLKFLN